jgi:Type IV secretion system pilin
MKIKPIKLAILTLILSFSFVYFTNCLAQAAEEIPETSPRGAVMKQLEVVAKDNAGYTEAKKNSITIIIARVIKTILGFLGILFLVFILASGFQWMTAGGNEEKITKAQQRIKNATIGLAIIIFSYTINTFIWEIMFNSTIT